MVAPVQIDERWLTLTEMHGPNFAEPHDAIAVAAFGQRLRTIEVKPEAQKRFVGQVQQALTGTVWNSGCKSWYLNEQGRNTAAWPGFTFAYRLKTRRFRLNPYQTERA